VIHYSDNERKIKRPPLNKKQTQITQTVANKLFMSNKHHSVHLSNPHVIKYQKVESKS